MTQINYFVRKKKKSMRKTQLTRRSFLRTGSMGAMAVPFINFNSFRFFAGQALPYSARAIDLVNSSLVIDMLSLLDMTRFFTAPAQGEDPLKFTAAELETIKASGIDIFHPAVGLGGTGVREASLQFFGAYNGLVAEHPDHLMRIDSAADLEKIRSSQKMGIILGLQNSDHFEQVADVKRFYQLGQRISQLTYNTQNRIASGSTDRIDGGISDYGARIVAALNEVGMVVDVSHCGDQTTLDAFELSTQPVLITHSNCRALAPGHPRCKTDEAITKMAAQGGVMGLTAVRNFVSNSEPTTLDTYIDHIDHVVRLTGIEHVGIGTDSDLNGYDDLPPAINRSLRAGYKDSYAFREKIDIEGMDHPKKMYDLTEGLIRRGYTDDHIRLILGGNFARALAAIWG